MGGLQGFSFSVLVILACYTKRAHFPFGSWLPEAMAAPTPVSALVHSSTLVAAGLFLLIRLFHNFPPNLHALVGVLGLWTLLVARFSALIENDRKKIIAYSTMRQLGLMRVALSFKRRYLAFFHLVTHAVFKALLFVVIGFFLLSNSHTQDLRNSHTKLGTHPVLSFIFLVCLLALGGLKFLSGFFSKDLALEYSSSSWGTLFKGIFYFSLRLTVLYRVRLFLYFFNSAGYSYFCASYRRLLVSKLPWKRVFWLFFLAVLFG